MLACQVIYCKCSAATPCSVPPIDSRSAEQGMSNLQRWAHRWKAVDAITWAYVEGPGGDALAVCRFAVAETTRARGARSEPQEVLRSLRCRRSYDSEWERTRVRVDGL